MQVFTKTLFLEERTRTFSMPALRCSPTMLDINTHMDHRHRTSCSLFRSMNGKSGWWVGCSRAGISSYTKYGEAPITAFQDGKYYWTESRRLYQHNKNNEGVERSAYKAENVLTLSCQWLPTAANFPLFPSSPGNRSSSCEKCQNTGTI